MIIDPIFTKWAVGKALDLAFEKTKRYLAGTKTHLKCTKHDIEAILDFQQMGVQRWCEEISFKDLGHARSTVNVYVGLSVYVLPRSIRLDADEAVASQTLESALNKSRDHLIVLGQPGSGKTTSMKYICHQLMHDETFLPDGPSFPLLLRLRDLNLDAQKPTTNIFGDRIIIPAIAKLLGLTFRFGADQSSREVMDEESELAASIVLLFLEELIT